MPTPSTSAYTRPDLDSAFVEFDAAAVEAGFIGLELAPPFNTPVQSGTYPIVPIAAVLEEIDTRRSNKGGYAQSDFEFDEGTFATREHGAEERIDDRQAAMYADSLDFDVICGNRARYKVLSRLERDIRDVVEALGSSTTPGTVWSQYSAADPVNDVLTAVGVFETGCGVLPNRMWMTGTILRHLARCSAIKDQIKYSGMDDPKMLTEPSKRSAFLQALADLFGVPKILVADAMRNTANKGQTASLGKVWTSGTVGLIRVAETNDLAEPCAVRTFVWDGDGAGIGGTFETYRDEGKRSDMMRFRHERQIKTMLSTMCYRLTSVA